MSVKVQTLRIGGRMEVEEEDHMRQPLLSVNGAANTSRQALYPALIRRMYVGHFLARWGARMWEFSVGLYMINIWPDSLLFTAAYGVVEAASSALFGSSVGSLVDRLTYMQVIRLWLLTQNVSFMVAGVAVTLILVFYNMMSTNFATFMLLVVLTNISGALGVLSTLAGTILIEREWVVVIAKGQSPEILTKMNATIRRIDLICKLLAPVFSGFIISFISLKASSFILALWNILSVWLQYWLLTSVYDGIPALRESSERRKRNHIPVESLETSSIIGWNENIIDADGRDLALDKADWKSRTIEGLSKIPYCYAWILYARQEVMLPGVALALLYFSVLSFGTLMTATLEWKGIPAYLIGIARGISAIIGISATIIYPVVHSHISTLRTGLWSIWIQWCFLLVCLASIWVQSSITSAWMLMGGVAASRLGLWMFDLAVMQQMQDHVPDSDRIIVGGVQNSLQSTLDLLTYIMGVIVSNPQDFGLLVIMSIILVSAAALLYTIHVYRVRKHLFHFDKLLAKIQ